MENPKVQSLSRQPGHNRTYHSVEAFKRALIDNLYYSCGQGAQTASIEDIYQAFAYTIRDYITDRFHKTTDVFSKAQPKFVYYLSAEYLTGKQISSNLLYSGAEEIARQAMKDLGYEIDDLLQLEPEPALGNGGLGRLAACYADSLATLNIPAVSYGINYEYGIFKQGFKDGWQVESPDDWLYYGNPWEFRQADIRVTVGFGGQTEFIYDNPQKFRVKWVPETTILGEPFHMMVAGYDTNTVNLLRLWEAKASQEFNLQLFDLGDYIQAAEQNILSENISKVLYPNDQTEQGRELRLKQEYFFSACSLADILRRFFAFEKDIRKLPEKAVIQLNDTHPVVAIPELMRILIDDHQLEWDEAWSITTQLFAYTCHTLAPEALEKWPVSLFERLLPRHIQIIYEINRRFLLEVQNRFPNETDRLTRMSLIDEKPERMVRMAYLAAAACFSINGVAELHSKLLRQLIFADFYEMWPEKFNNKTNGVTPRRFIQIANPSLAELLTTTIGEGWQTNLDQLKNLEPHIDDAAFRQVWRSVKRQNRVKLAQIIQSSLDLKVDPDSLFDVMVKRLHEYKRQLLQTLHIIALYNHLRDNPNLDIVPRTFIFGAKAAPGYQMAKLIIKLINSVGEVINQDASIKGKIKVAFLPNFNVTLGERIYPAADLSEQISLAGYEASGTGNMKFALNGAVTIGTLDGANIEICDRVGSENFFQFGLSSEQVLTLKKKGYTPVDYFNQNSELKSAIDSISSGMFSQGVSEVFRPIIDSLLYHDDYLVLADYPDFITCQQRVDQAFSDVEGWTRKSILNTARCGFFSSDRSIKEYNESIWKTKPVDTGKPDQV